MTMDENEKLNLDNSAPTYGVSDELVAHLKAALAAGDIARVQEVTEPLHAADVAELISSLDSDLLEKFVNFNKKQIDPDVLACLEDQVKEQVLKLVGPGAVAAAIAGLDSDDAIHVLEDLDKKEQREILRAIPAKNRAMLEEVLTFHEDSAGRLMQREIVCVPTFWTIQETVDFIRESQELPETFYDVYVVDPKHHPIGVVSLNVLLRNPTNSPIAEVMDIQIKSIPVSMEKQEVARIFQHYALVSAPVVSPNGRIVGMITVDDIVDVIEEEVEADIMHLAGVSESDFHAPVFQTAYNRSRWLFVTLINTLIASSVISQFQNSIEEKVALSFLMVIVAAMGGNAGMQTITVTVRALATKELEYNKTRKSIIKEILVASITSVLFATILGSVAAVWLHDTYVGIVLGIALICNMLWAGFAGTFLPIMVRRLGMDPAISAGPLLTTTTDVLGYSIFLGLATLLLL
jgi:magnesium transporter